MKAGIKSLFVMMFALSASTAVIAADLISEESTFETDGASHYKDGKFTLAPWGDGYTMRATLERDGREYEVEAFLRHNSREQLSGSGYVIVRYPSGGACRHRFGTKMFITEAGMYLRENMPGHIPYSPTGACQAAGPYVWFNHSEPYRLLQ